MALSWVIRLRMQAISDAFEHPCVHQAFVEHTDGGVASHCFQPARFRQCGDQEAGRGLANGSHALQQLVVRLDRLAVCTSTSSSRRLIASMLGGPQGWPDAVSGAPTTASSRAG